jgi:hypothetical protein
MNTIARITLELVHELWDQRPQTVCPYVRHSNRGCWCASPQMPKGTDAYMPCESASLQLWCLTEQHYTKCCLWPAGDVP